MSNIFSKYKKELAGVKVVSGNKVWLHSKNGNPYLNSNYEVIGKIDYRFPNLILKANKKGYKTGFIEDFNCLTKNTKSQLVDYFYDKNGERNKNKVAYLVRTDKKTVKGSGIIK